MVPLKQIKEEVCPQIFGSLEQIQYLLIQNPIENQCELPGAESAFSSSSGFWNFLSDSEILKQNGFES
jgi:hypothetical protein